MKGLSLRTREIFHCSFGGPLGSIVATYQTAGPWILWQKRIQILLRKQIQILLRGMYGKNRGWLESDEVRSTIGQAAVHFCSFWSNLVKLFASIILRRLTYLNEHLGVSGGGKVQKIFGCTKSVYVVQYD